MHEIYSFFSKLYHKKYLHCLLHCSCSPKEERNIFFSSFLCLLSPQLGILWLPTPIHALHWWTDTALSRITSQISHPSEVNWSLECLYNLSDMSETDRLDFLIFRTWYPPEQNTTAFRYKPDEKNQIPTTYSTSSVQLFLLKWASA